MELVRLESLEARGWPAVAVTVGNFDGVHRGHQALVGAVLEEARAGRGTSLVLTFDPHPSRVLSPGQAPAALMTLAQKAEMLDALGVERVVALPFTKERSRQSAAEFVEQVLHRCLAARVVVVGASFRFGRGREGDLGVLDALGARLGFRVRGVGPVIHDGAPISSSRIRDALQRGAVDAAAALLGRRPFVDGRVVRGEGRGRRIGVPTANLDLLNEAAPGGGVYACCCRVLPRGERVPSVVNVGRRPTFGGGPTLVEVHLLDFEGDLYDRTLRVEFALRLREERRFGGVDALREQIQRDVEEARRVLSCA